MWSPNQEAGLGADTLVGDMMTKVVIAVRPQDTVRLATDRVIDEKISAVPVLDEDGRPLGLLSRLDLLRAATLAEVLTAEELMPANVHMIHRGSTLALAAATMVELKTHRLIAIDDGGTAVGMLSSLDVMCWLAERAGYVLED